MSQKTENFSDKGESVFDFSDEFLVVCPKCFSMARVLPSLPNADFNIFSPRKLVCSKCGLTKNRRAGEIIAFASGDKIEKQKQSSQKILRIGGNFDWYFQESLWLQISCCGKTLWAYNAKHLEFIENYVSAKLRERTPNRNQFLASRLPKWMKSAKNRAEILKATGKLREKIYGNI